MHRITLLTQCWNESIMLTHFIRYYEPWVDRIVFVDGNSTDGTVDLIKSCKKGVLRVRDTKGFVDDEDRVFVRNTFWREFVDDTDVFIFVDPDELIYSPNRNFQAVLDECERLEVPLMQCEGYRMIGTEAPPLWSDLTKIRRMGIRDIDYDKPCVWFKDLEPKFVYGGHNVIGKDSIRTAVCFMLLHYKYLSREFILEKIKKTYMAPRNYELHQGFGADGREGKDFWLDQYEATLKQAVRII